MFNISLFHPILILMIFSVSILLSILVSNVTKQFVIFNTSLFQGLQAIRCPAGLAFDIEKQTCDWKAAVRNCDAKSREKKVKPLLNTEEPICQENYLACGDGNCIERGLFCNGAKDCSDGSDENSCGN